MNTNIRLALKKLDKIDELGRQIETLCEEADDLISDAYDDGDDDELADRAADAFHAVDKAVNKIFEALSDITA